MATITVDNSEWDALTIDMHAGFARVGAQGAAIVRRQTLACEGVAKIGCPVDTGYLRSSISSGFEGDGRSGNMTGSVTAAANYAGYVNGGTSRMAAQPFMTSALAQITPRFVAEVAALGDPFDGGPG